MARLGNSIITSLTGDNLNAERLPRLTSTLYSCGTSQGEKSELITVSGGQSIDRSTQESPWTGRVDGNGSIGIVAQAGGSRWVTIVVEGRRRSDLELLLYIA